MVYVLKDLKDSASYDRTQGSNKSVFWLSPLAAPLVFLRILENKQRTYSSARSLKQRRVNSILADASLLLRMSMFVAKK
ncbi:hypothetical protein E5S67_01011 [Microcoleus sp. IPMA8]|uniref:Uncharacterized protein n=1 Tax=Microcoleus asticus IPMA8 TaxID=2563858 RepID=A0ABX2CT44_9CYAN|nr:hypothetical protein [Microcoleus asticus IPMA8]